MRIGTQALSRQRLVAAISAVCVLTLSAERALGANWPERVGTAVVRAGEVTRGRLPLIEYADGTDVEAPVIVIAGKQRGPVGWLISTA